MVMIRTPLRCKIGDDQAFLYDADGNMVAEIKHPRADEWASYITMAVNGYATLKAACHSVAVTAREALKKAE